jgi:hypothetical protein
MGIIKQFFNSSLQLYSDHEYRISLILMPLTGVNCTIELKEAYQPNLEGFIRETSL